MGKGLNNYSKEYLFKFVETSSLAKLEKMVEERKDYRLSAVVAAFLFHSKKDVLLKNEYKYKNLSNLYNEYSHALKTKEKDSKFYEVYNSLVVMKNRRKNKNELKQKFAKLVRKHLSNNNRSLNFYVKKLDLKYSNSYNFVYKNNLAALSLEKANLLHSECTR